MKNALLCLNLAVALFLSGCGPKASATRAKIRFDQNALNCAQNSWGTFLLDQPEMTLHQIPAGTYQYESAEFLSIMEKEGRRSEVMATDLRHDHEGPLLKVTCQAGTRHHWQASARRETPMLFQVQPDGNWIVKRRRILVGDFSKGLTANATTIGSQEPILVNVEEFQKEALRFHDPDRSRISAFILTSDTLTIVYDSFIELSAGGSRTLLRANYRKVADKDLTPTPEEETGPTIEGP